MKKLFVFLLSLFLTFEITASNEFTPPKRKAPSQAQREETERHNRQIRSVAPPRETVARPYAEYEPAKYVLMSAVNHWGSEAVKAAIAQHLPAGVKFVVFNTPSAPSEQAVLNFFSYYMSLNNLLTFYIDKKGSSLWSRDHLPVPVFHQDKSVGVVDAKYYHSFEPDERVSEYFGISLHSHNYRYEGGNFIADTQGNCLSVRNSVTDAVFKSHYGCKKMTRLPKVKGIGHVDESVKLMSDKIALTDTPSYVSTLEGLGYEVRMLPRPENAYETYVNSLLINGTVFIPIFGQATDAEAVQVYRNLGLKTVTVRTNDLSNEGLGSIHCITMTYPQI